MRVLHLPNNIASQISVTVGALRANGIDAVGLALPHKIQSQQYINSLPEYKPNANLVSRLFTKLKWLWPVCSHILRADIIHWHFSTALPFGLDVILAKVLGKKLVVEFWGSDVRKPEIEMLYNPYYQKIWETGNYEYKNYESAERSQRLQRIFGQLGAVAFVPAPSIMDYVDSSLFRKVIKSAQRVVVSDYAYHPPQISSARRVIMHAPTAPHTKGSFYIEEAINKLKQKGLDFDYVVTTGLPHAQAVELRQTCDIFIDQIIYGDYGLAAIEAMAMGKPVVCFLRDSVRQRLPESCPIISATPDDIETVIEELLKDPERLVALGQAGRKYVESFHDADKVAKDLVKIYQSL